MSDKISQYGSTQVTVKEWQQNGDLLSKQVETLLELGWQPLGAPVVIANDIVQFMVR